MKATLLGTALWCALLFPQVVNAEQPKTTTTKIKILKTKNGYRIGLLGSKGTSPAPTLFIFAGGIEEALGVVHYNRVGKLLAREGYLCVSLDMPCHGTDSKDSDDRGLTGWRKRLEKGEKLVGRFVARAARVLDYLVKEKYTDPKQVCVCGTSRGGFMALHFAAADPRVKCVAGCAPVTNLLAVSEFDGLQNNTEIKELSLSNNADKLAGRAVWICIGNNDLRVSTEEVIAYCRKLVKVAVERNKPANVELHVMPVKGHRVHATAPEEVARWILKQMKRKD
jgi:dienelactone hydrolase